MKRLVLSVLAVAGLVLVGSNAARANDYYEYQRQLIIQEFNTKCRLIGLEAQRMLRENDYQNATAISVWQSEQIRKAGEEMKAKLAALDLQYRGGATQPQPAPQPAGYWVYDPATGSYVWVWVQR